MLADNILTMATSAKPKHRRTRSRDVVQILQKALRPRRKEAEDLDGDGSSSDELDDDDAFEVPQGSFEFGGKVKAP